MNGDILTKLAKINHSQVLMTLITLRRTLVKRSRSQKNDFLIDLQCATGGSATIGKMRSKGQRSKS